MTPTRLLGPLAASVVLLAVCGCARPNRVAVSGAVTFRGEPLHRGSVEFVPADPSAAQSAGSPVRGGRYAVPAERGLLPGRYAVRVSAPDAVPAPDEESPGAGPVPRELIPARYNVRTELAVEVTPGGPAAFDFDLD